MKVRVLSPRQIIIYWKISLLEIDIAKLRIAVAQSKTRKEIPIKYGIISTPYIEYVLSKLIIDNNITIFVCDELLTELKNVLLRPKFKKHFNKKEIKDNIEFIKLISTTINIDQRFDRAPDSKDNYLLDLCYTVKSYYLVTGDKPLLNLKHIGKIQLISPAIFYKLVKQQLADL